VPAQPPPGRDEDSIVLTFAVPAELAGLRLDRFLQNRMPRLSRTRTQAIIDACAFRDDGKRRRASDIVRAGEVVMLVRERFQEPETPLSFDVLFEDDAVLGVDKPAGLPMHPTATYHKHTLSYLLRERYGDDDRTPSIAHRLDRETSGVVLCGKSRGNVAALKRAFETRAVEKTYLAIVDGVVARDTGSIALPLAGAKDRLHVLMEVRDGGLEATSEYRVLGRAPAHSLVELHPRTGRQHQLRVHLAAIGHPVVGDKLYGPEQEAPFLEYIDTGMTPALEARLGHARQALHAHRIRCPHPSTGAPLEVTAPLATDLRALWVRVGGADA
jgi:23S rRNA pseudouridine1911/1915/1917 synthase